MDYYKKRMGKEPLYACVRDIREKNIECFTVVCPLCKTENYVELEKCNFIDMCLTECICCGQMLKFIK